MEILIIWLLCGIGCAAIASGKNRNTVGWFVCGCLFGIFALVAAFIAPKINNNIQE